jgi:hypothetical protein
MIPDPEKVRVWEARAPAYDRLCRRWEIFSLLSNRLIDLLPTRLQGPVLKEPLVGRHCGVCHRYQIIDGECQHVRARDK